MDDETASSYYQPKPDKVSLSERLNPLRKLNYWKLVPILKLIHGRRYKREATLLRETGRLQVSRSGITVRYEINNERTSFDISPDQGESYLNYLRGNVTSNPEDQSAHVVNSIATIEAIIKTKNHLIY